MNCKEFREILDLYVDKELSPEAMATAQIHVNKCGACRRAETQLLRQRRALQVAVSRHEPPQELVNSIRNLIQPRWRKLLTIRDRKTGGVVHSKPPLWRQNIRLPVPAFVLLLVSALTFGFLFLRVTLSESGQHFPNRTAIKSPQLGTTVEATDFSSFDHGGRATLYKAPR
jgi:hypothetical protein